MRRRLPIVPAPHAMAGAIVVFATGVLFFVGAIWLFWLLIALFVIDATFDAVSAKLREKR